MGAEQYKSREEWVYESLKSDILDLRLKPGQLLKEAEICEKFGVSRTPVRDAIRLLHAGGGRDQRAERFYFDSFRFGFRGYQISDSQAGSVSAGAGFLT